MLGQGTPTMRTDFFRSAPDLLETAAAVEDAAARRYGELAEEMRRTGNNELEAIFTDLAAEEGAHLQTLQEWAGSEQIGRKEGNWRSLLPEASGDDEASLDPYALTAYRALSIAVHNEERAFAFFSAVAADAEDPEVRELAERLAHEELGHAAKLRQARRVAYRAAGGRPGLQRWSFPRRPVEDLRDLLAATKALEAGIAARHEALAARHAEVGGPHAEAIAGIARESREAAALRDAAEAAPAIRRLDPEVPGEGSAALRDMLLDLEEAYAFYTGVADVGPDEAAVLEAQRLARSALRRLAHIREALSQGQSPPWH